MLIRLLLVALNMVHLRLFQQSLIYSNNLKYDLKKILSSGFINFEVMFTERQNKVSKQIQKDISDIFQRNNKEWFGNTMVTVTVVRITKDLSIARIYLSVFPSGKAKETIELLNANVKKVRYELGNRIRHQVKKIPELEFYQDDSLDHIDKISELLKS